VRKSLKEGGPVVVGWAAVYVPRVTVPEPPSFNPSTAASSSSPSIGLASSAASTSPRPPTALLPSATFPSETPASTGSCSVTVSLFYSPAMVLVPAGYTVPGGGELGV